jgi:hypothetical protein
MSNHPNHPNQPTTKIMQNTKTVILGWTDQTDKPDHPGLGATKTCNKHRHVIHKLKPTLASPTPETRLDRSNRCRMAHLRPGTRKNHFAPTLAVQTLVDQTSCHPQTHTNLALTNTQNLGWIGQFAAELLICDT